MNVERPIWPTDETDRLLDYLPKLVARTDYRIGLVGAGGIAASAHLPAYHMAGFPVTAIWNRTLDTACLGTMGELFRAIELDREPGISGEDNLATLRVVFACYRSATEHRSVRPEEIGEEVSS